MRNAVKSIVSELAAEHSCILTYSVISLYLLETTSILLTFDSRVYFMLRSDTIVALT